MGGVMDAGSPEAAKRATESQKEQKKIATTTKAAEKASEAHDAALKKQEEGSATTAQLESQKRLVKKDLFGVGSGTTLGRLISLNGLAIASGFGIIVAQLHPQ